MSVAASGASELWLCSLMFVIVVIWMVVTHLLNLYAALYQRMPNGIWNILNVLIKKKKKTAAQTEMASTFVQ